MCLAFKGTPKSDQRFLFGGGPILLSSFLVEQTKKGYRASNTNTPTPFRGFKPKGNAATDTPTYPAWLTAQLLAGAGAAAETSILSGDPPWKFQLVIRVRESDLGQDAGPTTRTWIRFQISGFKELLERVGEKFRFLLLLFK